MPDPLVPSPRFYDLRKGSNHQISTKKYTIFLNNFCSEPHRDLGISRIVKGRQPRTHAKFQPVSSKQRRVIHPKVNRVRAEIRVRVRVRVAIRVRVAARVRVRVGEETHWKLKIFLNNFCSEGHRDLEVGSS